MVERNLIMIFAIVISYPKQFSASDFEEFSSQQKYTEGPEVRQHDDYGMEDGDNSIGFAFQHRSDAMTLFQSLTKEERFAGEEVTIALIRTTLDIFMENAD